MLGPERASRLQRAWHHLRERHRLHTLARRFGCGNSLGRRPSR